MACFGKNSSEFVAKEKPTKESVGNKIKSVKVVSDDCGFQFQRSEHIDEGSLWE